MARTWAFVLFLNLFFFTATMSQLTYCTVNSITENDYNVLYSLYNSTYGKSWTYMNDATQWVFTNYSDLTSDPCTSQWYGVTCASSSDCFVVVGLNLSDSNLRGKLPDDLWNLTQLEFFCVANNLIAGPIPKNGLSDMIALNNISISNNLLSGSIPDEMFELPLLRTISLENNNLSSSLPMNLNPSSCLQDLDLASNALSGPIPGWLFSYNLLTVDLSENVFSGSFPTETSPLLQSLDLSNNALTSLPPSLSDWTNLHDVNLAQNNIVGSLPEEYPPILKSLILSNNMISNQLPPSLGLVPNISTLLLDGNHITGPIPPGIFFNMTNLLYLNIAYNYLTGAPVGFQDSNHSLPHQLITYNVSNNLLTGPWPDLKYLTSLQYLDLSSNSLSSTLPSTYGDLTRLTFFYAQNNTKPTGSLPIALSKLSLLEVLVLTNNNFTGPIYKNLPSPNLTTLDISGNAFTGTVPTGVFQVNPRLQRVVMGKNCFQGSLPVEMCAATELVAIELNEMSGLYANTVNASTQLLYNEACSKSSYKYQIDISWLGIKNQNGTFVDQFFTNLALPMSGSIPTCLFELPKLQLLYLAGNSFTGTIPPNISASVTQLALAYNHLTGTIPTALQSKTDFTYFDLAFNQLTGTFSNFQAINSSVVYVNNNFLSGPPSKSLNSLQPGNINILSGNVFSSLGLDYTLPLNDPSYPFTINGSEQLDIAIGVFGGILAVLLGVIVFILYSYFPHLIGARPSEHRWVWFRNLVDDAKNLFMYLQQWKERADAFPAPDDAQPLHPVPFSADLYFCVEMLKRFRTCGGWLSLAIFVVMILFYPIIKSVEPSCRLLTLQYGWIVTLAYAQGDIIAAWMTFFALACMLVLMYVLVLRNVFAVGGNNFCLSAYEDDVAKRQKHDDSSVLERTSLGGVAKVAMWSMVVLVVDVTVVMAVNCYYVEDIANRYEASQLIILQMIFSLFKMFWNSAVVPAAVRLLFGNTLQQSPSILRARALLFYINNVFLPCLATAVTDSSCFVNLIYGNDIFPPFYGTIPQCIEFLTDGSCASYGNSQTHINFVPGFVYNNSCSHALLTNYIPVYIYSYSFQLLFGLFGYATMARLVPRRCVPTFLLQFFPLLLWPETVAGSSGVLLNIEGIVSASLHHFIILLTFGLSGPVLAISVGCTIVVGTLQWHLLIGRYLEQYVGVAKLPTVEVIGTALGVWRGGQQVIWVAVFGCGLFYAFVLTDLIGGFNNNKFIWPVLVLGLIPLGLFILVQLAERSLMLSFLFELPEISREGGKGGRGDDKDPYGGRPSRMSSLFNSGGDGWRSNDSAVASGLTTVSSPMRTSRSSYTNESQQPTEGGGAKSDSKEDILPSGYTISVENNTL